VAVLSDVDKAQPVDVADERISANERNGSNRVSVEYLDRFQNFSAFFRKADFVALFSIRLFLTTALGGAATFFLPLNGFPFGAI
jgi:hypothetical protein